MSKNIHNYTFSGWPHMPWKPKRDFIFIDRYLDELAQDVYPQPPDIEHTKLSKEIIDKWIPGLHVKDVLDVGCGEGFCQPFFEEHKLIYKGIALGGDVGKAKESGRTVYDFDFHFIPDGDNSWDLIFARHALEHSPMPILALMEWHRVARYHLIVVLPKPKFWLFIGRNHYSVVTMSQARFLLDRSGWEIIDEDHDHEWEYRFLCEKKKRVFSEETEYLWAYEDEKTTWLDMAEPFEYEKEEEEVPA
jgi:SAM-dependent methyltransferase